MGKCHSEVIQADCGLFRHIQTYTNIIRPIQAYSGIQAYSEPRVTLAYSDLWYIQNPGISKNFGTFRTRGIRIFRTLGYSEPDT